MIPIPQPQNMQLHDWADQVSFGLDTYGAMPKLLDDDWQMWASQVLLNHSLPVQSAPSPYVFDDWKLWGQRFLESLM